ncbi:MULTISPECIES: SDR family oxidoreductase [Rhizobium]|uniref:SDR family oxidoreductase n=1 Tax=Rhizobium rhododendri TaxID=2506430 RepID=A0ABY8IN70_9HYPH|nr:MULTISPECIES: SDR family oxidoreductase [Rhizobium]MBZ5758452.1 SDR family oxidoreductase [Rhizobium sp. VS19-DR96]MBZ5764718.1 SDR family oxidoreductase [Rhizobium sp. VS19-DR129.2]MBZ5772261.1 SDR family oxidoreductase [Rhizobium sp. VS19-DRK62.2]MBZ5783052.1 SDR family oxidoreductase [Rhizobium sp. VS19-DR121]MBZ5800500.1 SDR family oxidoreductase [Rhizobium sp. VS19-DR181]
MTLLVTGAAGKLGQSVVHHLLETYKVAPGDIVAATRSPEKLGTLAAKGVVTRKADFDDAAGLVSAFAGIDRLLIISTDSLDTPGKRLAQHKAAIEAAKAAGVKHILYTSMPNPDKSLVTFAPDHLGTENAIKASGIGYTILRDAWYLDNFMMSLPHNLQGGKWYTATSGGKAPYISREDCALAIAAALASSDTESKTYTLTGSTSYSITDVASTVSAITGRPLEVIDVTDEQLAAGMAGAGLPPFLVDMLVSADANIRAGNFDSLTADFTTLTGKVPQTLRSFFEERKAELAA